MNSAGIRRYFYAHFSVKGGEDMAEIDYRVTWVLIFLDLHTCCGTMKENYTGGINQ